METEKAKNGMISQNVEILVDLGFLKISRTLGCMKGDRRIQKLNGMISQNVEILVHLDFFLE